MRKEGAIKDTKVQLRMRPSQKDVIARAAELKQATVTNFMVDHAFSVAHQILADQTHFYLSPGKWEEFCAALDAPPKDLPALRKLLTEPSVFDESKHPVPITREHATESFDRSVWASIRFRLHSWRGSL